MTYSTICFSGPAGRTARLVVESAKLDKLSIGEVSRFFPDYEATKMHHFDRRDGFSTFEEAFLSPVPEHG